MSNVSTYFPTAVGAMRLIKAGAIGDSLSAINIEQTSYDLLTSKAPWLAIDRNTVRDTLNSLINGTMQATGTPPYEVPAEYVAAVISVFVDPVNQMLVCRWMEGSRTAVDMASDEGGSEPLVASRLFALVVQLANSKETGVREAFEKRCGIAMEKTTVKEVS